VPPLDPRFFRHEYGRLVAVLSRRFGLHNLARAEDAAQSALEAAVRAWPAEVPARPSAWLYRVAHNAMVSELRTQTTRQRILDNRTDEVPAWIDDAPRYDAEIHDGLLRMLFVCCDPDLPRRGQLVLALKTLCGFGAHEIAQRLFVSTDSVYKTLQRARARLRTQPDLIDTFDAVGAGERIGAVHTVLYVMFTEGHLSSTEDSDGIRRDLCDEAVRLSRLLYAHPLGRGSTTAALVALMLLHLARLPGRVGTGGLLLLDEQDRSLWDAAHIAEGLAWLERAATDDSTVSRYHLDATIAAEHCTAASHEDTAWERIAQSYALLERVEPSPLHRLSRAVAAAEAHGAAAGLALLEGVAPPTWLEGSATWWAVLADLERRAGDRAAACRHRDLALRLAPTEAVRALIWRRWRSAAT